MAHKIQLVYTATAVGNVTAGQLATAMAAVALYTSPTADPVLCQSFGLTVASDVTSTAGKNALRTIVLNMDPSAVGGPTAPPSFAVQPQTVDSAAAVWSSSAQDDGSGSLGIGAQQVQIAYLDAEGNAGTSTVLLNGTSPVQIPLAGGTKGVASVTGITIVAAGSLGANLGQITVAQIVPPAGLLASQQDALQAALGFKLAYMPPSFYSFATSPGATSPSPTQLQAMLTNLFTNRLALALSTAVTASVPTLV